MGNFIRHQPKCLKHKTNNRLEIFFLAKQKKEKNQQKSFICVHTHSDHFRFILINEKQKKNRNFLLNNIKSPMDFEVEYQQTTINEKGEYINLD